MQRINRLTVQPLMSQAAAAGALPTLLAATAHEAMPGGYYGPSGLFEMKGPPGVAAIAPQAQDRAVAARLGEVSEALTDLRWPRTEPEQVS